MLRLFPPTIFPKNIRAFRYSEDGPVTGLNLKMKFVVCQCKICVKKQEHDKYIFSDTLQSLRFLLLRLSIDENSKVYPAVHNCPDFVSVRFRSAVYAHHGRFGAPCINRTAEINVSRTHGS